MHPLTDAATRPMEDLADARGRFLAGDPAPAGVRPVVLASWERCRAFGVDPGGAEPQPRDAGRLRRARERERVLLECAEPFLALAHDALADQPHLLAIADRDGLILRIVTGPDLPEAEREPAGLVEGASWHERDIGCNGVGTCLATGEPVILIGPEHFQERYVGWTCIGVPIRAGGEVVGALDLSVPNEHTHVHTWGWVLSVAKGIEASLAGSGASTGRETAHEPIELDELDEPFHGIRGVLDLLASQLDFPPTHAGFVERARADLREAEALLEASVSRLRVSEERLRRIAESGMVGLLFWELGGRVTYANDRFLEMIGCTREDLVAGGVDWRAMTPPEWDATDRAAIAEIAVNGVTTPFEKEFVRRDGTRVPVLVSAATFRGATDRGVTLVHDITERKRSEQEILRAYEEARQAVLERDNVLAIVSHDLRNPLNAITMATSLLQDDIPEAKKQGQVNLIRRATDQMTRLVRDLLDASQLEAGGLGVALRACPAGALVHAAVEFLTPLAEARSLTLRSEVRTDAGVRADLDRIHQVFVNLVSNAVAHTAAGGEVVVRAEPGEPGEVRFSVEDSGTGILPEHLPHLFDRFWQARKSGRAGAGLGLTIARGIVEAHDGRIWAESEPGRGSTFHFTLPEHPG
jgi:PAS domain S-box-containing protein